MNPHIEQTSSDRVMTSSDTGKYALDEKTLEIRYHYSHTLLFFEKKNNL